MNPHLNREGLRTLVEMVVDFKLKRLQSLLLGAIVLIGMKYEL